MAIQYLKKSPKTSSTDDTKTTGIVQDLLKDIETTKEQGCIDLTKKFDKYDGDIIVSKERIEEIKKTLDQKTKDDVQFSYDRVRKFAEAQLKNYGQDFEVELSEGLFAGQKLVPVNTAGCYVPGGRYAHIASAVMSVTTAKVAGVKNVINFSNRIGISRPKVAVLSATEEVLESVPSSLDAAELTKLAKEENLTADVFGPLAFDNSISKKSAGIKGIKNTVAGEADVLLVPSVETGNGLVKMMIYFMGACAAGVVVGGKVPVVITSRSDEAQARLASIAAAVVALD